MPDRRSRACTLLLPFTLLAAAPAAAGDQAPMTPAPPPVELTLDPPDAKLSADDSSVCRNGKLSSGPESVPILFCMRGVETQSLDIVVTIAEAGWSENISLLDRPEVAVAFLSDRRFEDFWPLLFRVGGADGGKLIEMVWRTRMERAAATPKGQASGDTLLSSLPGQSRAVVVEARILTRLGLTDAALDLLDQAMPKPDRKGRFNGRRSFETVALLMTRASTLHQAGRHDDALAAYRQVEDNMAIEERHRMNATVNRAALLAELGQASTALAVIEPAAQTYSLQSGSGRVEGSMRQFDWIRSCALYQVGRRDEAAGLVAGLFAATPASSHFFVPTGDSLEGRYRWCIGDADWISGKFAEGFEHALPSVGVVMMLYGRNPPFPRHEQTSEKARAKLVSMAPTDRLREPPAGWADLLDRVKLGVRARAIHAAAPAS